MDERTARELIALNNRFYAEHAASFSATRSRPWPGWDRVLETARVAGILDADPGTPLTVLDLACGNLRFERFLAERMPGTPTVAHTVDACDELALTGTADELRRAGIEIDHHSIDILAELLDGRDPLVGIGASRLSVCFGFMHHVPGSVLRLAVARALANATAAGGIIALSFWRFMDDPRLARKVAMVEEQAAIAPPYRGWDPAALEPGDHLLDWQADGHSYRYCHHTSEHEIDALLASLPVRELARFSADGSSGVLNRYAVLQRL